MNFNDEKDIRKHGFKGFKTINELWNDKSVIPKVKGVYLVINPDLDKTEFISPGVGGFFKGEDPNVSKEELKKNFVPNSKVVYIGKAGSPSNKATLQSRLDQYLKFGQTKNIGHKGGRYIWQLKNHADLVICWKETPEEDPREIEKSLLKDYSDQFGKRPFANLSG